MPIRVLLAALAATASLAACGGAGKPSSADTEAKNRQAMLAFARCMRAHGVDMADPKFSDDGHRVNFSAGGKTTSKATLDTAQKACAHYQKAVEPSSTSKAHQAEFRRAALANARCMREHGIDFPDPQFDENGGARVSIGRSAKPDSPKFKAAQKACEKYLPRLDG